MLLEKILHCFLLLWSFILTVTAFHPAANLYSFYSGPQPQSNSEKPTARHKNHCAYVVEKTVSFTVQDGAAPFMKAMKCAWGQKCPTTKYRMYYKPMYKVAYKTVTELEWKCCPGYTGVGCTEGYGMKARPLFNGPMPAQKGPMPPFKGQMPMQKGPMPPFIGPMHMQKGPSSPFKGPMPMQKGPMPPFKGPMPMQKGPMPSFKGPMPIQKGPMPSFKGPMPMQKGPMPSFKGPMPMQKGPMPSFKGPMPMQKGPVHSFKRPMSAQKGPMPSYKRPNASQKGHIPSYKGQYPHPNVNGNPWIQPQAPTNGIIGYPVPNTGPSSQDPPIESYPEHQEPEVDYPEPVIEPQDLGHDIIPEENEPVTDYQDPQPDHQTSTTVESETEPIRNAQVPSGGSETNQEHDDNNIEDERLDRIEEDVQRLSLGLETLRGTVTGLEDSLRASLREDANRMLTALISAAPSPISAPSLSRDSTVGFGDLPGGAPDIEGSDVVGHFPNLVDLTEKVTELRAELVAKSSELEKLRGAVVSQNTTLQRLSGGSVNLNQTEIQKALETMVESKMSEARVTILDGFEKRVESAEERCESRMAEVRLQCKEESLDGQDQIEQVLDIRAERLRAELQKLQAQLQDLEPEEGCCIAISGLTERVIYMEQSVEGLNESQTHLRAEIGGHKDHIDGMLEGRLAYVESKLNIAFNQEETNINKSEPDNLEVQLEGKIKALETRLLAAVEELGNVTAPTLLEGQAVPSLETEVELLRRRVEDDLDHLQKQLKSMEVLCTSACVPQPVLTGYAAPLATDEDKHEDNLKEMNEKLDLQVQKLNNLNATLYNLLVQLAKKQEEVDLQGEVTLLKVTVNSVNRSICGLQDSLGSVIKEVGHTNLTWQEREERLAQQVKGVVQLVGRQASMLGTGERKLTRLKGELHDLRRKVAGELQGCRSTALGVQKEVTEVGGRVARVEGQCGGLAHLSDDLERIRGELEKQSDGYLSHVNSTLVNHSHQLSELRDSIQNCTGTSGPSKIVATTQQTAEQHTTEPTHPRGDQFAVPTQHKGD
ncbi:EMILIN-3 [Danio rerio]|uniref:EMILIN-3 n=1 Tax=Danio rerio TaxID=7955 RepID=A0A8M9PS18_DANRE|nr:EMILIN-3 [Danio rerio]|eukprot:XP_699102.3 EMILIN-3 [Danio rerio]